ncbi:TolC family protein [Pirellulaceae bacterium SH449]
MSKFHYFFMGLAVTAAVGIPGCTQSSAARGWIPKRVARHVSEAPKNSQFTAPAPKNGKITEGVSSPSDRTALEDVSVFKPATYSQPTVSLASARDEYLEVGDEVSLITPSYSVAVRVAEQFDDLPRDEIADDDSDSESSSGATLNQIINQCLISDPVIRAGLELINQSSADALTASLKPNPEFNIDQTLLPLTRPFIADEREGGPPQLDIGLEQPIDWFLFGKRAAEMQAARLQVRVTQFEYADLVRQRVLEAAEAYYDVLEAKAIKRLSMRDVENLTRVEELTERSVSAGGRPPVELQRVRLDRLRAEQELSDADNDLVAAIANLRSLLGSTTADPDFDIAGTLDDIDTLDPLPVEEAMEIALTQRPDINALRSAIQQARAETWVEYRNAFPEMAARIGYTRQFQEKAIGFPDANSFGFGLGMSLPVHNRNQGNRVRAASVLTQSSYELQAGEAALRAEIVQATSDLRTALRNSRLVAEEQLKLAIEVRDSLNKAYDAGGRPLIDVLDAQRNYRETYRLYIESRANLGRAIIRYYATLGEQVSP